MCLVYVLLFARCLGLYAYIFNLHKHSLPRVHFVSFFLLQYHDLGSHWCCCGYIRNAVSRCVPHILLPWLIRSPGDEAPTQLPTPCHNTQHWGENLYTHLLPQLLIQFQDADLGFPLIILESIGVWHGQIDLGEVLTFLELCLFLVSCDSGSQMLLANSLLCCHLFAHLIGSVVNFPVSCHHRCCVLIPTTPTGYFLFLVRWWPGKLVQSAVMHHASEKALEPDCPASVPRSSTSQLRDLGQLI